MASPALFRVECSSPGCAAVCCGVGEPQQAVRAIGWLFAYGQYRCPLHRPDGLIAGASEAAKYQAAVRIARVAEGVASVFIAEPPPPTLETMAGDAWQTAGVWGPSRHPSAIAERSKVAALPGPQRAPAGPSGPQWTPPGASGPHPAPVGPSGPQWAPVAPLRAQPPGPPELDRVPACEHDIRAGGERFPGTNGPGCGWPGCEFCG